MSWVWQTLSLYESIDLISRYYEDRHGIKLREEKSREIVSCLAQGREYFTIASNSSELIRPVILYYGTVAMSRGLVLFLRPNTRETTLLASHGLRAVEWKDQLSKGVQNLPDLRTEIHNGSFTELQEATCNAELFTVYERGFLNKTQRIGSTDEKIKTGTLLTVRDIISRIPDLRYLFEQTFRNFSECYKADIQLMRDEDNKSVRVIIQQSNLGLASFDQIKTNLRLPDGLVQNNCIEDNRKSVNEYSFNLTYQSEDELFKKLPAIQNDQHNYMFLVSPLPDGTRLSSTASLYIIAYAMSMLARYYPSSWLSIINRTKGDFAYPIMKAALSLVQEKFPQLILQGLQHLPLKT